jgi:hypothetical protein
MAACSTCVVLAAKALLLGPQLVCSCDAGGCIGGRLLVHVLGGFKTSQIG